jgi:signal transduction histidine kinase
MGSSPHPDSGTLEGELLGLLGRQGRRMPLPVLTAAVMICLLARDVPHTADTALASWLLLVAAMLAIRMVVLGRLPSLHKLSLRRRLNIAVALSAANGCTHALGLIAFPAPTDFKFAIQTLLLVGLCSGAVATTAGYRPVFVAYLLPVIGALVIGWAPHSQPIAIIIAVFGAVLVSLAADSFRLFGDSFGIRLQQVQLNARLRDALLRAELANRAKTRFLASASHDLRQPIHTVSLFAAALALRPLDPVTREISQHIDEALQELAGQLDALLDISKLDAGVVPVNPTVFSLAFFLRRMEHQYAPLAMGKGLAMAVEAGSNSFVLSDELLLARVVGNLLDNAIKYSSAGTVRLSLHGQAGLVAIIVADDGPGIPAEEQERVFEEFYQLANPERNRAKGLGLGLSIVHRLAALLPARLEMVSLPGRGTSFYLILPAHTSGTATGYIANLGGNALAGLDVLVIDDEAAVRQGMKALLTGLGATVTLVDGAGPALAAIACGTPDLLLVDLRLRGDENGIAVIRAVRKMRPGLPAILISGDTSPERLREASDANIALLHKPVPIEQLQRLVAGFSIAPSRETSYVS